MKNYKLFSFVFILSLILIGSSGVKSANAANCASGDLFSSVTGQACSVSTTQNGCVSGNLFSTTTGQPCSGNTSVNNSSAVTQFNNLFKSNFQIGLKGNSDVSALQQFLKDQGYYFGKIDGSYGRITARAVSDFKGDNNLSVTVSTPVSNPTQSTTTTPSVVINPPTSATSGTTPAVVQNPIISYLQEAGCTSNIGTSYLSGNLCSATTLGATVYVFGSNFTSNDKVFFGDGSSSVTPLFISSTSLSFVAPINPGGQPSIYVGFYSNGNYSVSNSVMLPYQSSNLSGTVVQNPIISYLQVAGCTSNIGIGAVSGDNGCSATVPGATVYVFGNNFTSDDQIYFSDGRSSVAPLFISSTSLSFVVPTNPGGLSSIYVGFYPNNGQYYVSNSVALPYQ